jgi:hypothetical protein
LLVAEGVKVVDVLRAVLVSGPEAALLPRGQARYGAPGDQPAAEGVRRVSEEPALQVRLAAGAIGAEGDRVDIDPAVTGARSSIRDGIQSVPGRVPELPERRQAATQIRRVDGKVQVAVPAGPPAGQRGHSPSATHPGPHPGLLQRLQDSDDVRRLHAAHASGHGQARPAAPGRTHSRRRPGTRDRQ